LALILQLRAARADIYIDDFRDELPAVLLSMILVDSMHTENRGVIRGALLRLYRYLGSDTHNPVGTIFAAHAGSLSLLEAVLPDELTLPKMVKVLCAGKGTLEDLCRLGRRSLTDDDRDVAVGEALDAALALIDPSRSATAPAPDAVAEADVSDSDDDDDDDDDDAAEAEADTDETPTPKLGPREAYVHALRTALTATFDGMIADPDEQEQLLQSIQSYDPLGSRIPTIEEARLMNQGTPGGGGSTAPRATSAGGGGSRTVSRPAMGGGGGGGGGSTISIIRSGTVSARTGGARTPGAGGSPKRSTGGSSLRTGASTTGDTSTPRQTAPPTDAEGKLQVPNVARHELDKTVQSVAIGLNQARKLDERVWLLFADPEFELDDPRKLGEDLVTLDSPAAKAATAMRLAAQQQRVRGILELPQDRRMNGRRFDLEAEAWLNTVANYRREYDADSRQLISLPKMLDYAAGALIRVEAIRAAVEVARDTESAEEITVEVATQRYELLLSDITFLADHGIVDAARARADADAATVLAAVVADAWIERVCTAALDWAGTVIAAGACKSVEALKAFFDSNPITLAAPGEGDAAGAFPDALAADTALGEIVDTLRVHVLQAAWKVLLSQHRPLATAGKLDLNLRRLLRAQARITTRRERHQKNPRIALPVASLERLSGNAALKDLFVRLTTDGKLLFLEDYEDGSFIDVFALRANQKRQMHARARERARDDQTGELQPGSSYLYTVGRTNNPFARSEAEILAACVVDDDGEPVIFDPF
ncbi:MAG: hypothetical protein HN404_23790, partial [Gemmatimonadetes bacterium]|nr:hypothetical protein [Gemmatimonadota bacterium]